MALTMAMFNYMHVAPLKSGEVKVEGFDLDFVDPGTQPPTLFRKQTREPEYDICEMGITTAIAAREYGIPLTPIPIFPVRRFDYDLIFYNINSSIKSPADLTGATVVARTPNVTIDILCAAMLKDMYGVDLNSIHYIVTGENHISEAKLPPNCELRIGADPAELLESGEADATFGGYRGSSPDVQPLFADIPAIFNQAYAKFGTTTVHHSIVIKNDVIEANPNLPAALCHAFTLAKQPFLQKINAHEDVWDALVASTPMGPSHDYGISNLSEFRLPDPVPYGLAKNGPMLESLMRAARDLNYVTHDLALDEIFACPGED